MHEASLRYDKKLVRRAVWAFGWRSLRWSFFVGCVSFGVYLFWLMAREDRSLSASLFGSVALLGIIAPMAVFWAHYRNSMAKFLSMKVPVATFLADDAHFTVTSDGGSVTLGWVAIKEVWSFDGFWLLLFSRADFVTIPLVGLSDDMRADVLDRIKRSGGRIAVD